MSAEGTLGCVLEGHIPVSLLLSDFLSSLSLPLSDPVSPSLSLSWSLSSPTSEATAYRRTVSCFPPRVPLPSTQSRESSVTLSDQPQGGTEPVAPQPGDGPVHAGSADGLAVCTRLGRGGVQASVRSAP